MALPLTFDTIPFLLRLTVEVFCFSHAVPFQAGGALSGSLFSWRRLIHYVFPPIR